MNISLREKINQLFILGFNGRDIKENNKLLSLLKNELGGVIFFTRNIQSKEQFKKLIQDINSTSKMAPFLSIDQEGGRVERTENIHAGKKYLSALHAVQKGKEHFIKQTKEIIGELKEYGINLNFTPVLDVNTNSANPIIGERAFGSTPDVVVKYGKILLQEYQKAGILTCGKHYPGHGESTVDSHKSLPVIDVEYKRFEETHIKPFKLLIEAGLPMIMVAHVHYPMFDEEPIPASISNNVINNYLINKLKFKGLVISDDMVMGGISDLNRTEACIRGLKAGINMFIYRNLEDSIEDLISSIENSVKNGMLNYEIIEKSYQKVIETKKQYKIIL